MHPSVPVIDLLDMAYVPSLGFGAKELKKKRENLLKRSVTNW